MLFKPKKRNGRSGGSTATSAVQPIRIQRTCGVMAERRQQQASPSPGSLWRDQRQGLSGHRRFRQWQTAWL
jgi:hypothetical protein